MAEEYEILPHRLLEDLKYDVEALKKKLSEPESASKELIAEMEELRSNLRELTNVFREALKDVKEEDSGKLLQSLQHKVEAVTTQNETIARGMIAISDKLEEFMRRHNPPSVPRPVINPHPRPMMSEMPPPPPGLPPQKRKGIFR